MQFEDASCYLFYERLPASVAGGDVAPLLFLHGALGSRQEVRHLLAAFPERECILVDLPGHGLSHAPSEPLTIATTADLLLRLLRSLEIASVDIVGYSLGGYLGIEMALRSPMHVRSIISHAMKFYWSEEMIETALQGLDWDAVRQNERRREKLESFHTGSGAEQAFRIASDIIAGFRDDRLTEERVKQLRQPLLLSVGDTDQLVPLAEILSLYQSLGSQNAALSVLEKTHHAIGSVQPEPFAQAARHFWKAML